MYEMRRRKPEPTLLLSQGIFNLGMLSEELTIDDAVSYTVEKWIAAQLNIIAVTRIRTLFPMVTYPAL